MEELSEVLKNVTIESIQYVKDTAPFLWETVYRRIVTVAYAKFFSGLFLFIIGILASIFGINEVCKCNSYNNDGYIDISVAGICLIIIGIVFFAFSIVDFYSLDYLTMVRISGMLLK